jgi:hypothetical protein
MKIKVRWPKWVTKSVSAIKKRLVEKFTKPRKIEIFVIVEAGVVHEIINLPDNISVTVIDYDVESVEDQRLEISPVDGELCLINKW